MDAEAEDDEEEHMIASLQICLSSTPNASSMRAWLISGMPFHDGAKAAMGLERETEEREK
jgi:hypothetical protein